MAENRVRKLNLGCGIHVCRLPGWENIDNSWNARLSRYGWLRRGLHRIGLLAEIYYRVPWPRDIRVLDVTRGLPYASESIEVIYTSHMLEHLSREQGGGVVREAYRVLRAGGILRVVVPDLEQAVENYVERKKKGGEGEEPPGDVFVRSLKLTRLSPRRVLGMPLPVRLGVGHRWMYDFGSLRRLLEEAGFQEIERRDYLESALAEIGELDIAERAEGSLYVEARKAESG